MALQEWHYKVLHNLDQSNKWILGTDIQYINGDMTMSLTYVSFFLSQSHLVTKFGLLNCVIMDLFLYIQVANTLFLTLHILKDLRPFEIIIWNLKCDNYVNGQRAKLKYLYL